MRGGRRGGLWSEWAGTLLSRILVGGGTPLPHSRDGSGTVPGGGGTRACAGLLRRADASGRGKLPGERGPDAAAGRPRRGDDQGIRRRGQRGPEAPCSPVGGGDLAGRPRGAGGGVRG